MRCGWVRSGPVGYGAVRFFIQGGDEVNKPRSHSGYSEKLKDPRWQKKRLEILERDGWTSKVCHDKKSTLHVHHLWYEGKEPWEVSEDSLVTLCESCHEEETATRIELERGLLSTLKHAGLMGGDIAELDCLIENLKEFKRDIPGVLWNLSILVGTDSFWEELSQRSHKETHPEVDD